MPRLKRTPDMGQSSSADWQGCRPEPQVRVFAYVLSAAFRDRHDHQVPAAACPASPRRTTLSPHSRAWGHVQDVAVGYGYRPLRAGLWLMALLVCGAPFSGLHPQPRSKLTRHRISTPSSAPSIYWC
ncbi:hypothetical protein [Streptomyces sp. MMG1533]|uniref:hypothetical protein n=1 Tax=Streptomyces sp. MMG1533 TaxID=1415546 RepID=UPI000AC58124|nr:hypothetical protein [Streptomyces sp. MMG1533]